MEKQNLLIFAHYYYPDVASTGQLLQDLSEGLQNDFCVTVVCTVPSYGGTVAPSYKARKYYFENIRGIRVIRVRVPDFNKESKISRVRNVVVYFFRALWAAGKVRHVQYVYSISQPPVLGGLLGVCGKWLKRAKYIYNIQDFNPEQTAAAGYSRNPLLLRAMMRLDKFSCRKADKIILVGRDMVSTLKKRFQKGNVPRFALIHNWVDEKNIRPLPKENNRVQDFKKKYGLSGKFVFMYSGNLGLYYDLLPILGVIKSFKDRGDAAFVFVGNGCMKSDMLSYKRENALDNVFFIPYQVKEDLVYSLNAADVHWCVNAAGIKGISVPSKLYGIMAAGKPVLGVLEKGSDARITIEDSGCGLVCDPGDYEGIRSLINWFLLHRGTAEMEHMGAKGRACLDSNNTKAASIQKYIEEIKSC